MKKILAICFVLMLVTTTVMAEHVISSKENPQFLFVMSAQSGSFDGGTLTLKDVPLVTYFSDRPDRIAGHISLKEFVDLWKKGPNSFKSDPPNATLSIFNEEGNKDVVVELSDLQSKGYTLTFKVRVLTGDAPASFEAASLFVDAETPAMSMGAIYQIDDEK